MVRENTLIGCSLKKNNPVVVLPLDEYTDKYVQHVDLKEPRQLQLIVQVQENLMILLL